MRLLPVLLVAALAVAPGATAAPAKGAGIRLAAGIGPVALGEPRGSLEQSLGRGVEGHDWYGAVVRYPSRHLHVSFIGRSVLRVGTTWRGYRTNRGIGPSTTVKALRHAYPHATCDTAERPFDHACVVPAPSPDSGPGYTLFYVRAGVVREVDVWLIL